MRSLTVKSPADYELASKEAALRLLKDGVVALPTDTLYGLSVNALDPVAIERLFKIKGREKDKGVPVLVNSISMAKKIARILPEHEPLLAELWPGPYTVVFKKQRIVPLELTGGKDTVAIRFPQHPLCISIIRDFEGPITATSANIAGEEPLSSGEDIERRFNDREDKPDLILDVGHIEETNPSTIIDLTVSPPKILRVNPTSKEKLMKILSIMQ